MSNKTGTREWSKYSINIATGCEHNCRYCYARYNAVYRYKKIKLQNWPHMFVDPWKIDKDYSKMDGVIMYPTTHDITPSILSEYLCVLKKLLDAGNQVLIVTKPHLECIATICKFYQEYKSQILFRFTIGSMNDDILKFWEPGAPSFKERWVSIRHAYQKGYNTSVSAEPFLDDKVEQLYEILKIWLTESFWIGKLNDFEHRVDEATMSREEFQKFALPLLIAQMDNSIIDLYNKLKDKPFIQWKDSIKKIIEKHGLS